MSTQGKMISKFGQRYNIWEISPEINKDGHPAPFPFKLAEDHIVSWSNKDDIVYDPFMGSGTVAGACIKKKRNWIGSEITEEYFKIIQKRIRNKWEIIVDSNPNKKVGRLI